jgi:multisubunit Na+/H+ antiporter MnhB subunit
VTALQPIDAVLVPAILGAAAAAVAVRDRFAAIVAFIVCGLLLAIAWVRLGAVDVALAEGAIGAGLTGVLLLGALARMRPLASDVAAEPAVPSRTLRLTSAALAAAIAAGVAVGVLTLPSPAPHLGGPVAEALPALDLGNPVTGVLLAFRGYDTLLETVVLLLALLGVWSLAPEAAWGGFPGLQHRARPEGVLTWLGRLLPPIGIMVGTYVFWVGADRPGGAFQAGTILAAVWILAVMSALVQPPAVRGLPLRIALVAGPAVFLVVGLAGFGLAGAFLGYPTAAGWAKAVILLIEAGLTLSIAATLALLVAGTPERAAG